jgi:hypothetical protein
VWRVFMGKTSEMLDLLRFWALVCVLLVTRGVYSNVEVC